jgi:hypothetical protein
MGQITLYLDEEAMRSVREAAKAAGVSRSRWVADLVRKARTTEWPPDVVRLAGAWPDLALAEALRGRGTDAKRERL